MVKWKKSL